MKKTLEKIRASLPTHIMLTSGVHKWREGDEFYSAGDRWKSTCPPHWVGQDVSDNCRRPIPSHILDNQAFWLRFGDSASRRIGTREEHEECAFLRPDGNGGAAFYVHSTAGRLYDKWLLEQMECNKKFKCKQCGHEFDCAKDNPAPANSCDERSVCPECESLNW